MGKKKNKKKSKKQKNELKKSIKKNNKNIDKSKNIEVKKNSQVNQEDAFLAEEMRLLKKVSIFSQLGEEELKLLAKYSGYYRYKKGYTIFCADSLSDELFVIKEGSVVISKKTNDGTYVYLARFIKEESFGELDLLDTIPRQATATADEDTEVLIFPRKEVLFQDILYDHPDVFAPILYKLMVIIAGRIRTNNKMISERTPWVQDLRKLLYRDKLTGLYNLTFLEEEYGTLLPGYGKESSLLFVKPDNFKDINDTYGHEAGDNALIFLSKTIRSLIREEDIAIRYKGNEIAIILPNTDKESAISIANSIRAGIHSINISNITNGDDFFISMSAGLSMYPEDSEDGKTLVDLSYKKLYMARNQGGNATITAI